MLVQSLYRPNMHRFADDVWKVGLHRINLFYDYLTVMIFQVPMQCHRSAKHSASFRFASIRSPEIMQ